jgi:hypothetical protein
MSKIKTAYGFIWVCGVVIEEASREGEVTGSNHDSRVVSRLYAKKMRDLMTGTGGCLVGGVPLPNSFLFRVDFENPLCRRTLMSPASTVVQGWRGAPASKDSHLCWHKTAGGCCARQHKCLLAVSTNRLWSCEFYIRLVCSKLVTQGLFVPNRFKQGFFVPNWYQLFPLI